MRTSTNTAWRCLILGVIAALAFCVPGNVPASAQETSTAAERPAPGYDILVLLDESGFFERRAGDWPSFPIIPVGMERFVRELVSRHLPAAQTRVGVFAFGSGFAARPSGTQMPTGVSEAWRSDFDNYRLNQTQTEAHDRRLYVTDFAAVAQQIATLQRSSRAANRIPIVLMISDFLHNRNGTGNFHTGGRCVTDSEFRLTRGDVAAIAAATAEARDERLRGSFVALYPSLSDPGTLNDSRKCERFLIQAVAPENARLFTEAAGGGSPQAPLEAVLVGDGPLRLAEAVGAAIGRARLEERTPILASADHKREPLLARLVVTLRPEADVVPVTVQRLAVIDGSAQLFVKELNRAVDNRQQPPSLSVALSAAEEGQLLERPNASVRAVGTHVGSGKSWETDAIRIRRETLEPIELNRSPAPRIAPRRSSPGSASESMFDLNGLAIRNGANSPRILRDVVIVSADDPARELLAFPIRAERNVPENTEDFRIPPIPLTAEQFQTFRQIARPQVGVTTTDQSRPGNLVDLERIIPPSRLNIVEARLDAVLPGAIRLRLSVENVGDVPALLAVAELRRPGETELAAPEIPLDRAIGRRGRLDGLMVEFPVADMNTVLNSRVAELDVTLKQSDAPPVTTAVNVRTDPKGIAIDAVTVPPDFGQPQYRLEFAVRNNRTDPPRSATVIGVRAYPRGEEVGTELRFESPLTLKAGAAGKGALRITDDGVLNRLRGRIVNFTPLEERDLGRSDIYPGDQSMAAALARVRVVLNDLRMEVGTIRPEGGGRLQIETTLHGNVEVFGASLIPEDVLRRAVLDSSLVRGDGVDHSVSAEPPALLRSSRIAAAPNAALPVIPIALTYIHTDESSWWPPFSATRDFLSESSVTAGVVWNPEDRLYGRVTTNFAGGVKENVDDTLFGVPRFYFIFFKNEYMPIALLVVAVIVILMIIGLPLFMALGSRIAFYDFIKYVVARMETLVGIAPSLVVVLAFVFRREIIDGFSAFLIVFLLIVMITSAIISINGNSSRLKQKQSLVPYEQIRARSYVMTVVWVSSAMLAFYSFVYAIYKL